MKRIDATTRQKVIELHKEGKEIKEIPQILNNANIKISYGSVWNIVEASRSPSKATEPSNQVDQSPILTIPDALMRDHCSLQALSTVVNDSKSGPSGCPLSRFILQKNSDLEDSKGNQENNPISSAKINQPTTTITNTNTNPYVVGTDMEDIDILDPVDPNSDPDFDQDVFTDPNADYDPDFDGGKGEHRFKLNPYPTPRRIEIPDRRTSHNNYVIKKTKEIEENSEESYQSRSSTSNPEDHTSLGIDWDENHQARFVKWVMDQKKIRQQEERKLQEQWGILVQEKNNLEQQKRDLEVREASL
ncbi:MAG: hypothetical protein WA364_27460 [Candidatus Nitrosopolaris sp.]